MTDPLDHIRAIALPLPETAEPQSHGQPTFFVAGRQVAQYRANHDGDGRTVVCVRTGDADEQAMLLEAAPDTYMRPAYLASSGWVGIDLTRDADWALVAHRVTRSWEMAAPRRLRP